MFVLASKSSAAADLVAGEIEVRVPDLGVSETFDAREAARVVELLQGRAGDAGAVDHRGRHRAAVRSRHVGDRVRFRS